MDTHNDMLYQGAMPIVYENARSLRKVSTAAEDRLWEFLRGKKLDGLKFRRQHAISIFIADFYCHEKKLVIEVDGAVHNIEEVKANDEARTRYLNEIGIKVIRFTNNEVFENISDVLRRISNEIIK